MIKGLLFAMMLVPQLGAAQSIACKNKIIDEGVTKAEVVAACGPPTQVTGRTGALPPAMGEVTPPSSDDGQIEVWIYNFGPTKLMQRIWFEDGRVKRVESLGYGH